MFLATVTGLVTGAPETYILGQVVLGLSVFISLSLLADRPLINPIQAFVFVFYWWFGVGPAVISAFKLIADLHKEALAVQVDAHGSTVDCGAGLAPLRYRREGDTQLVFRKGLLCSVPSPLRRQFLHQSSYYLYCHNVVVCSYARHGPGDLLGIVGIEETSMLGGTKTTIWWVGVIAAVECHQSDAKIVSYGLSG